MNIRESWRWEIPTASSKPISRISCFDTPSLKKKSRQSKAEIP
jgi:hypothetical protein